MAIKESLSLIEICQHHFNVCPLSSVAIDNTRISIDGKQQNKTFIAATFENDANEDVTEILLDNEFSTLDDMLLFFLNEFRGIWHGLDVTHKSKLVGIIF